MCNITPGQGELTEPRAQLNDAPGTLTQVMRQCHLMLRQAPGCVVRDAYARLGRGPSSPRVAGANSLEALLEGGRRAEGRDGARDAKRHLGLHLLAEHRALCLIDLLGRAARQRAGRVDVQVRDAARPVRAEGPHHERHAAAIGEKLAPLRHLCSLVHLAVEKQLDRALALLHAESHVRPGVRGERLRRAHHALGPGVHVGAHAQPQVVIEEHRGAGADRGVAALHECAPGPGAGGGGDFDPEAHRELPLEGRPRVARTVDGSRKLQPGVVDVLHGSRRAEGPVRPVGLRAVPQPNGAVPVLLLLQLLLPQRHQLRLQRRDAHRRGAPHHRAAPPGHEVLRGKCEAFVALADQRAAQQRQVLAALARRRVAHRPREPRAGELPARGLRRHIRPVVARHQVHVARHRRQCDAPHLARLARPNLLEQRGGGVAVVALVRRLRAVEARVRVGQLGHHVRHPVPQQTPARHDRAVAHRACRAGGFARQRQKVRARGRWGHGAGRAAHRRAGRPTAHRPCWARGGCTRPARRPTCPSRRTPWRRRRPAAAARTPGSSPAPAAAPARRRRRAAACARRRGRAPC